MVYNRAIPQPNDLISNSQSQLLGNFQAIDSGTTGTGIGFSRNHVTMTDATNGGLHSRIDFYQSVVSPVITGFVSSVYPKTVTNVELFYKNASADLQLTNSLFSNASGQGWLPGGMQIRTGQGNGGTSIPITFSPAFPTACLAVVPVATGLDTNQSCIPSSVSSTGFTLTTSKTSLGFYWIAIGY